MTHSNHETKSLEPESNSFSEIELEERDFRDTNPIPHEINNQIEQERKKLTFKGKFSKEQAE